MLGHGRQTAATGPLPTASFSASLRVAAGISAAIVLSGCDRATIETLPTGNDTTAPVSRMVEDTGAAVPEVTTRSPHDSLNWENDPGVVTSLPPPPPPGQQGEPYPGGMTPHFIHDVPLTDKEIEEAQKIENEEARRENREPVDLKALRDEQRRLREHYLPQT